jgi:transcriptional regulator with XRE-family HTH domain
MSFSATQCRAARALLNWSQAELAQESGVATKTIADYERGDRTPYERTISDIRGALEAVGIEFTNGDQPGVRCNLLKVRQRNAGLRAAVERAVKDADQLVVAEIDRIGAEPLKSHGEPQSLWEILDRLKRQQRVLESAGVEFTNGDGPGVRLRKIPPQESIPSEDINASNDE